jgi:hypothetical protein
MFYCKDIEYSALAGQVLYLSLLGALAGGLFTCFSFVISHAGYPVAVMSTFCK